MQNSNPIDWFEIVKVAAEIILSLVAIIISVIAIRQTKKQTELSNKHQLFERRLSKYTIISSLINNYEMAREAMKANLSANEAKRILYTLTDQSEYLELQWIDTNNINISDIREIKKKTQLLEETSEEIPLIFDGKNCELIPFFVSSTSLLIVAIYIYLFSLQSHDNATEDEEINTAKKHIELEYRKTEVLYKEIIDKKVINELIEQIKLK